MRRVLIPLVIALFAAALPAPAVAGGPLTLTVTREDDPAPNGCVQGDTPDCSIREALDTANERPGADTIVIPAGVYRIQRAGSDSTNETGDFDILDDVTITGAGPGQTIIDGDSLDAVFSLPNLNFPTPSEVDATIEQLTIREGTPGVFNAANLTLDHVEVTNNHREGDGGGIVSGSAQLTIRNSTISNNSATFTGGAIDARELTIQNSTVVGNTAGEGAGGIFASSLQMVNTTVVDNESAGESGGGVWVQTEPGDDQSSIVNSTITGNSVDGPGGGIYNEGPAGLAMHNTILRDNTASSGPDCSGVISGNNNLVESLTGCTLNGLNNTSGDPMLGPLDFFGGPTDTRPIPEDSVAKDSGDNSICPETDQRGVPRPQAAACDIGAYEYDYVGDVNCSGFADLEDVVPLLGYVGQVAAPSCIWRGNVDCVGVISGTDVLHLITHIAGFADFPRPQYCADIGPDPLP